MGRLRTYVALWAVASGFSSLAAQNVSEKYLLAAANQDRLARELAPLTVNPQLEQAARAHAWEMARRGGISHQFAGERDLAERAGDSGAHFSLVTENVAEAPDSAVIHEMWMQSAGHRANLLDARVTAVGIAVVQKNGQLYAVEDFARIVDYLSLTQQETMVAKMVSNSGLTVSTGSSDARQTCTMDTGFAGERRPWFVMRYTSSDIHRLPEELTARLDTGKYHAAAVGACVAGKQTPFSSYSLAVMLFP